MRKLLTPLVFLMFISNLSYSKSIGLIDALEKGWISLEAEGTGGHQDRSLRLKILNQKKKKLEINIPAGLIFHSQDSLLQDLIITQSQLFALEKNQKRSIRVYGMCIQASNGSPRENSSFNYGGHAERKLAKLVRYIDLKNIKNYSAQEAIWCITDKHRLEFIGDPGLAVFVAELLEKPIPNYYIQHARQERHGQAAFVERPSIIKGSFKYQNDMDRTVSFGLYDGEGDLRYLAFENQEQKKGFIKFKFYFEVRNIPKGTYYARLKSGDELVSEMKISF